MAKDGTNRGGRRVRAGAKPDPLNEKLAAGRPATRLQDPLNEPFDFTGNDIGVGAVLAGEVMPEPSEYLSAVQRDGKPLGTDLVYRETWQWRDKESWVGYAVVDEGCRVPRQKLQHSHSQPRQGR